MAKQPAAQEPEDASQNMAWKDAIRIVLSEADGGLHYTDIAEQIASRRLRRSLGATPASTVASYLSEWLRDPSTPYLRVGGGVYALRAAAEQKSTREVVGASKLSDQIAETGALRAFGMYWQRDVVFWATSTRLLGRQGTGATTVDFAGQVGVYLLHDGARVIYVGRALDALHVRLKAHTADRLGGRWDRFSWFGLRSVEADGRLSEFNVSWNKDVVVETMEAVLIESLEPPLNRRRGDNLSGIEYIQIADPHIETAKKKALLDELRKGMGL